MDVSQTIQYHLVQVASPSTTTPSRSPDSTGDSGLSSAFGEMNLNDLNDEDWEWWCEWFEGEGVEKKLDFGHGVSAECLDGAVPQPSGAVTQDAVPRPSTEAMMDAVPKPSTEAMMDAVPKPSTEAMMDAVPKPSTEAMMDAVPKPSTEATMDAAPKPSTEATTDAGPKPSAEATMDAAPEPSAEVTMEVPTDEAVPEPSVAVPEPPAAVVESEDPMLKELEAYMDQMCEYHGLIWDSTTSQNIELSEIMNKSVQDDGSWNANFRGSDGNIYSVARLPPGSTAVETGEHQKSKIGWAPVGKDGISDFYQNAWPKSGEASGSGLGQVDRKTSPSATEVDEERVRYPGQPSKNYWLGMACMKEFGNKPDSNESPMALETLNGMTLKDHMTHVTWYESPKDFKAKINPGVSQQLWEEMIEIFKMVNIYNIKVPEKVLFFLRNNWALAYYASIQYFFLKVTPQ